MPRSRRIDSVAAFSRGQNMPHMDASPAALARVRRGLLWLAAIVGTAVSGYMIAGCSAGLWVIGSVVEFMAEGTINHALGKKRMTRQIDGLTGHTIVCGLGHVGQILCKELTEGDGNRGH
jgi:hypothetical protein